MEKLYDFCVGKTIKTINIETFGNSENYAAEILFTDSTDVYFDKTGAYTFDRNGFKIVLE